MKRKLVWGLSAIMLTTVLFSSCSKIPQSEIDATNTAIEEAKNAGAEIYKVEEYNTLLDSMRSVMIHVENQKSKFIKNYTAEKKELESVMILAQNLRQETELKKEEIKHEIQKTMAEVSALVETNKQLIVQAPKGKEGTTALIAIKSELAAIEVVLAEAQLNFSEGNYLTTLSMVNASKEKATSINTELNVVISKYKLNQKAKRS
ncbi:MAG: hypothetical protein C0597_10580 [Marinilabiliales bacterium]|nr:MAG: hypothetical protein C0597_10580 [Marinilabiliales bacterium]